jgi:hypothetical protein
MEAGKEADEGKQRTPHQLVSTTCCTPKGMGEAAKEKKRQSNSERTAHMLPLSFCSILGSFSDYFIPLPHHARLHTGPSRTPACHDNMLHPNGNGGVRGEKCEIQQ